jgi:hypothetical protein
MNIRLCLSLFIGSADILLAENLRCYDNTHRSIPWKENCHACVLFIDSINISSTSTNEFSRKPISRHNQLSIGQVTLSSTTTSYDSHQVNRIVHQICACQSHGPLFGYNQTHCFCDSNQCNFNIQRCIHEVLDKGLVSCYHGSNSSEHTLEIRQKCRTCRLRIESSSTTYYECLTFADDRREYSTYCTCQQSLCNRDRQTCERLQLRIDTRLTSKQAFPLTVDVRTTIETVSNARQENMSNEQRTIEDSTLTRLTSNTFDKSTAVILSITTSTNQAETVTFDVVLLVINILAMLFM